MILHHRLENDANLISESVEDNWKHLKINLLKDTELLCGLSKKNEYGVADMVVG